MTTVIETERLRLRTLNDDDAPFIVDLLTQPSFLRFIGDRGVKTLEDAPRYLRNGPYASYAQHGFGLWAVEPKDGGPPMGLCGLLKRDWLDDPDIGFAFLPRYWGQGYAVEAARATLDYARDVVKAARVVAITSPDNDASIAVLAKIGFVFERMAQSPPKDDDVKVFAAELR